MPNDRDSFARFKEEHDLFPRRRDYADEGFGPHGGGPTGYKGLPYRHDPRSEVDFRRRSSGYLFPELVFEPWMARGMGYYDDYPDHAYAPAGYSRGGYPEHPEDVGRAYRLYDRDRNFWDRAGDEIASWFGSGRAEQRRRMDRYRGVGPRGYKRSDSRILEDVSDRLSDHPDLDASTISVTVEESEVTLDGEVSSRWDKRCAEACAEAVSGVRDVQNNLKLRKSAEAKTGG